MKIHIDLSEKSIEQAIRRLEDAKDNLERGLNATIEILTEEGAEVAQNADGNMAAVLAYTPEPNYGMIVATGDSAIIAEFGAGDDTLDPSAFFNGTPPVPVYPGSYSELVGSGEYADKGYWHFGGKTFYGEPDFLRVMPRQGLYKAKQYILENAEKIAKEVIEL